MRTSYLFNNPKPCPECGKAAAKHTETYNSLEPYTGNLKVLRDESYTAFDKFRYHLRLWDGETYIQKYGYFCSLNCTSAYANRMAKTLRA